MLEESSHSQNWTIAAAAAGEKNDVGGYPASVYMNTKAAAGTGSAAAWQADTGLS